MFYPQLVSRACLHYGDRSSTGIIAGSLYGAMWGFDGVPRPHLDGLEHLQRLIDSGQSLFAVASISNEESETESHIDKAVLNKERLV
jgi:hypothetical protein